VVGIPELADTKQWKYEATVDYIERWRNLMLNCMERISEASSIDICINMPHSFKVLVTMAHDLELQITRHRSHIPSESQEKKEPKKDVKEDGKSRIAKESTAITTSKVQISTKKQRPKPKLENKVPTSQPKKNGKRTLKELEDKEYPFFDSEVPDILDQLLREKLIKLNSKYTKEVEQLNDPKYCIYHEMVSHLWDKCFILNDHNLQLIYEKKIILDVNENVNTSNVQIVSC
ncbi:LOW QUALITY PROTEIN: hypothetical protein CFOL_v3_31879, partial [Cephalotus follicularis]